MVGEISRSFFTIILGRPSSTVEYYWVQCIFLEHSNTFSNGYLPSLAAYKDSSRVAQE